MQIGDLCFLAYESKFSSPWFRHCRVAKVHPDLQGTVRTVTVCFRPMRGKALRAGTSYPRFLPETMVVHVERLVVMLPREDQEGEAHPTYSTGARLALTMGHGAEQQDSGSSAPHDPLFDLC